MSPVISLRTTYSFGARTILWLALFLLVCAPSAFTRDTGAVSLPALADTSAFTAAALADTTAGARDSLAAAKSPSGLDSVVTYSAVDSVVYSLNSKTMYLYGKGAIKYKELGLKAENIDVNLNTSILNAVGVRDTSDSTGKKFIGEPDLMDGPEKYHGSKITYSFKSKKGKIHLGETEIEKGLYYGEEIKRVDTNVLFVGEGKYTTCELEHPHYYFGSPEMKVSVKDKVVARPVYLYIDDVPVFALPFGIFPSERGRRSGLIAPAYGESSARGRYLTHLGYFWAISDYMDLSVRGDGYTKGSWVLYSDFRYTKRYDFNGTISGSYAKTISGLRGDPGYSKQTQFNLHVGHNQEINPTTRLVVDMTFASGNYYQTTSTNLSDLLRQNILSNATLSKSWEGTPNSMSINVRRDQVIAGSNAGQVNEVLPSISFSRGQTYPFRPSGTSASASEMPWYQLIGYTYGGQFLNTRAKTKVDSVNFKVDERRGIEHRISVNASPKIGYFTFTPFFNYTESWHDKYIERDVNWADSSVVTTEAKAITPVRSYNMGISTGTKLYGMFQPGIFGVKAIRQQITPSLTYTYNPDFSKPKYGYFGRYRDTAGVFQTYNRYEREPFNNITPGETQSIGLVVTNVFEMKMEGNDSTGEDRKYTLLNVDAGISYNFAADSLRFSALTLGYRTNIGQALSISGSSAFNLYKFEVDPNNPQIGRRVNKFLINEQGRLAQLTNFSLSIGTRFSGEKKETKAGPQKSTEDSLAQAQKKGYVGLYDQAEPDFSIPWNLDLNWNFSQNQNDPRVKLRSSNISASLGFNLTEFWKISATSSYDVLNKQFAAPQITVYRDLHCWEMNFVWNPLGIARGFHLEIRLKAPQLRDVKVTKQYNDRGVY
jgi:lipopolysaccharide assembly outer membrane protein LptD (OstA)